MVWLWSLTKEMLLLARKENQENCGIFLSLKWNLIFSQWSKCIVLPYTEGGQWGSGQIAKSKSREWFCYYLDRMMNRSCCIVCLLSVTLIPHLLMGRHPLVCHAYWNKILLSSKKSKRKGKKCYPCHYYSRGQYATIFTTMNFVRTKIFFTLKLHVERIIWSNGIVSSGIVPVLWSDLYFFLYLQSPVKVFSFLFFFFFQDGAIGRAHCIRNYACTWLNSG